MKKILIVDDSPFMRNVLKEMIANNEDETLNEKFEVHEADGKKNALTIAQKENPDVILLDVVMKESEMEGIEFIVEANKFFDLTKIIMVTSIGHMDIINTCNNLGVKHYIQKPFEQSEVLDSIKKVIA